MDCNRNLRSQLKGENMANTLLDIIENLQKNMLDRKIIIWGIGSTGKYVFAALKTLGYDIVYFIDNDKNKQDKVVFDKEVHSPYYLLNENKHDIFVLSAVPTRYELNEQLEELGLIENQNYSSLDGFSSFIAFDLFDPLLGYSRSGQIEGFKVYGTVNEKTLKIVTLGGSNTDSELNSDFCWVKLLYDKAKEAGKDITIFNGAMGAYTTSQEMLKLVRDCIDIKPDIIVSLNGVNDICICDSTEGRPIYGEYLIDIVENANEHKQIKKKSGVGHFDKVGFGSKFNGRDAEYWYRNINIMYGICKQFGIKYLSFLQPAFFIGGYRCSEREEQYLEKIYILLTESDKKIKNFFDKGPAFFKEAIELSKNDEFIIDITDIFKEYNEIFLDHCHYSEQGNILVAEKIYKEIESYL